jgi:hypothetical protein
MTDDKIVHPPTRKQALRQLARDTQQAGLEQFESVQPPTREQVVEAIMGADVEWNGADESTRGHWDSFIADAVLALFPQPGPSAEPVRYNGHNGLAVFADAARRLNEGQAVQSTEPVSISDMAPGAVFRIAGPGSTPGEWWTVYRNRDDGELHVLSTSGRDWILDDIDPSTIRDVTPPKGDDRG